MSARKTVLITGCTPPGIGYHVAQAFHEHGYRVFATAREVSSLTDLAQQGIETLSLTVDDEASVAACYDEVCRLLDGRGLDFLINNAGRNYTMPALDISLPEVRCTLASNLYGPMHVNATFVPLLLRARGTIVHVGSVAAVMPYLFSASYNASKAALHAYANTLRVELAPLGLHVLTLVVGGVRSNLARTQRSLPEGSLYRPWRSIFARRVGHGQEVSMATRPFAREVLRACEGARGRWWNSNEVWMGARAGRVWWVDLLDRFMPGGIWGWAMGALFGFPATREKEGE